MKEIYTKILEMTENEHEELEPINKDPNVKIIKL